MAGLSKYFNSQTYSGRANVAKATYASFALLYIYYRLRRGFKRTPAEEVPPPPETPPQMCPCDQCRQYCVPNCPPPPVRPPPEEPKLSIPEDPLFKPQRKCECEDSEPRKGNQGSVPIPSDADDYEDC